MAAVDRLLEACLADPGDDEPRLVWADAIGGERGELVVIQCELARGGLAPAEAGARLRRQRELLRRHGRAWSGLGDLIPEEWCVFEFRRGFVEAIRIDASAFAEHGEQIARRAPLLRSLTACNLGDGHDPFPMLRRLIESPAFLQLKGFHLQGADIVDDDHYYCVGDDAMEMLLAMDALAQLDAFAFVPSGISAAAYTLARSGALARLEKLWLSWGHHDPSAVLAVLAQATQVKSLGLYGVAQLEPFASVLPAASELWFSELCDEHVATLGRSRTAASLEALWCVLTPYRICQLRIFPRLRVLGFLLTEVGRGELDERELAAALPAVRRLHIDAHMHASYERDRDNVLRRIARALGPQLELLELSSGSFDPMLLHELQSYVAGDVATGSSRPLL